MMKRFLFASIFWASSCLASLAGSGTIQILDGNGVLRTYDVITDGSGNYVGKNSLCDGAAAAQCAAVKAASTAAVATDPAVVVAVSPNNTVAISASALPLPSGAATQTTLASILTALGSPFQASGSIGNSGFNALQGGAANSATNPFFMAPATADNPWPISASSLPLPTGAATQTTLASILTNLGSPFQAGGNIGNTTFAVTQATASNLNMTCANCSGSGASGTDEGGFTAGSSVFAPGGGFFQTTATSNPLTNGQWGAWQMTANRAGFVNLRTAAGAEIGSAVGSPLFVSPGTGATWAATQSGTWNITNVSGTVSLPTGASTSANQTNASQKTQIVDGSGNVIGSTSNALDTNCSNCSGSGVSTVDGAAFTAGTSDFVGIGGQYTSGGAAACSTTKQCMAGIGADRTLFTQIPHAEVAVAGATAPADALVAGMVYNSSGVTPSNGQGLSLQSDVNGNLKVVGIGVGMGGVAYTSQTGSPILGLSSTNAPTATTGEIWPVSISPASGGIRIDLKDTAANTNPFAMNLSQVLGSAMSATNPSFARTVAGATGGASTAGAIVPNNTTAVVVKSSPGTLYGLQLYGINAAPLYVKFYNATSATCGSGTPVKRVMIPAAGTASDGAGSNISFGDVGVNFSTGITYCATTGIGDTDTTAPTASNFLINVDYL